MTRLIFFLICSFLILSEALSQIQLTLTIPKVNSPYLSDYLGYESSQILIISNTSSERSMIYLRGKIEQLNAPGYYLRTRRTFKPATAIILEPFETKTLFATAGDFSFLERNNLEDNIPDRIKRSIQQNGILPEGDYQICIEAIDFRTDQPVSAPEPAGCQFFSVTLGSPPQIINPICNDTIMDLFPNFMWTPAISTVPLGVIGYTLYIVEYNSRALNPQEMMEQSIDYNAGNPIVIRRLLTNSYTYSPTDIPLKPNTTYIACVVASDVRSGAMFENQGRSEICMFQTRNISSIIPPISIVLPQPDITFNPPSPPFKSLRTKVSGSLHHRFHSSQFENVESHHEDNDFRNGMRNVLSSHEIGAIRDPELSANGDIDLNSVMIGEVMIQSPYTANPINWNANPLNSDKANIPPLLFENNAYLSGSLPLPGVNVSIVEQYLLVPNAGQNINDYVLLDNRFQITGGSMPEGVASFAPVKLGTVRTGLEGRFEFDIVNQRPGGAVFVKENLTVKNGDCEMCTSFSGRAIIRVLRVVVEDPRYYSPNVAIITTSGNNVNVGRLTSLIKSYRAEIDFELSGSFVAQNQNIDARGRVVRLSESLNSLNPGHPKFESLNTNANMVNMNEIFWWPSMQAKLLYTVKMANDNDPKKGKFTIRNMIGHQGAGSEYYFMIDYPMLDNQYNYTSVAFSMTGLCRFKVDRVSDGLIVGSCNEFIEQNTRRTEYAYNYQYHEPVFTYTATAIPLPPKIYLQSVTEPNVVIGENTSTNPTAPLPNANIVIRYDHPGRQDDHFMTDANGKFEYQYPGMNGESQLRVNLRLSKNGYHSVSMPGLLFSHSTDPNSNQFKSLERGERWPASEIMLKPQGKVRLEVVDEFDHPVKSEVQFGEDLIVRTRDADCSVVFPKGGSNNETISELIHQFPPGFLGNMSNQFTGFDPEYRQGNEIDKNLNLNNNIDFSIPTSVLLEVKESHTLCRQVLEMDAPSGNNVRMKVDPMPSQYETLDTTVQIFQTEQLTNLGKVQVKFNRKRARFRLTCGAITTYNSPALGTLPIQIIGEECENQVHIQLNNNINKYGTGLLDTLVFDFEFVGQGNQFKVRIDAGEEFELIEEWVNIFGNNWNVFDITLMPAVVIRGQVIDKNTRAPIHNARVFVQNTISDFGPTYLETTTDEDGNFVLGRVKEDAGRITATKSDKDISYVPKSYFLPSGSNLVFELEALEGWDLSSLLGYSIDLSEVQRLPNDRLKISGRVTSLPIGGNFRSMPGENVRIPFKDVEVIKSTESSVGGRFLPDIEGNTLRLETKKYMVMLNNKFNAVLHGVVSRPNNNNDGFQVQVMSNLRIFRNNTRSGELWGMSEIHLTSFVFPNEFNARFYISDNGDEGRVRAFSSGTSQLQQLMMIPKKFFVGIKGSNYSIINPQYQVEGFDAYGERMESYLSRDTFSISTRISFFVPDMEPAVLSFPIGNVLIFKDALVVKYSQNSSVEFSLGLWKVKANKWKFDNSSIKLIKPKIETAILTVSMDDMFLRDGQAPFGVNTTEISSSDVMFGGVAPLYFYDNVAMQLSYDEFINTNKKVYRIRITKACQLNSPCDEKTCWIEVPQLAGERLDIKAFSIYSHNNESRVELINDKLLLNNIFPISSPQIRAYTNNFEIFGNTDLELPNPKADLTTTTFIFFKQGAEIKMELKTNTFSIRNMPGNVDFIGDEVSSASRKIEHNNYEVFGWINVKASSANNSKILFQVRAKFRHWRVGNSLNTSIETFDINQNGYPGSIKQKIWLTANTGDTNNGHVEVQEGNILVENNSWKNFRFYGRLAGESAGKGLKPGGDKLWFVVNSSVKTEEGEKIEIEDVQAGGNVDFDCHFDFTTGVLKGNFLIPTTGLTIGPAMVTSDIAAGFKFSPQGFYVYCQATARMVAPPVPGTLTMFMLLGSTPISNIDKDATNKLFASRGIESTWSKYNGFPSCLTHIDGLFFAANYTLVDFNLDIDLAIVAVGVGVHVGADMYFFTNFGGPDAGLGVGVLAYADVYVSARILFCTNSFQAGAKVGVNGTFTANDQSLQGTGTVYIGGQICSAVTFCESLSLGFIIDKQNGVSVKFGSNLGSTGCVPPLIDANRCK